jgi:hypothetical protein
LGKFDSSREKEREGGEGGDMMSRSAIESKPRNEHEEVQVRGCGVTGQQRQQGSGQACWCPWQESSVFSCNGVHLAQHRAVP